MSMRFLVTKSADGDMNSLSIMGACEILEQGGAASPSEQGKAPPQ